MNITSQLEDSTYFSNNEKIIAAYILEHKDAILRMSVQDLAKETYTSNSTVMRLCQKIGLSGYKEFKINFARELSQKKKSNIDPNFPFSRNDSAPEIANSLETLMIEALEASRHELSVEDIMAAASLLTHASHIAIFGVGDAYISGLAFQARMIRAGIPVLSTQVAGEHRHLAQTMHKGDVGIVLSYSGETEPVLYCARQLKANQAKVIAVTSGKDSELAGLADILLVLPNREKKFHRLGNFASHTSMEYYLNVLYSTFYTMNFDILSKKSID